MIGVVVALGVIITVFILTQLVTNREEISSALEDVRLTKNTHEVQLKVSLDNENVSTPLGNINISVNSINTPTNAHYGKTRDTSNPFDPTSPYFNDLYHKN